MKINREKCLHKKCHQVCRMACPRGAIKLGKKRVMYINKSICDHCKTCKLVCTENAIIED